MRQDATQKRSDGNISFRNRKRNANRPKKKNAAPKKWKKNTKFGTKGNRNRFFTLIYLKFELSFVYFSVKQIKEREEKLKEMADVVEKPLARYEGDEDLEAHLKDKMLADDPMLKYMQIKRIQEGKDVRGTKANQRHRKGKDFLKSGFFFL